MAAMQVLLKHSKDVKLDDLEVSKDFLTIFYRSNGLQVSSWARCQSCASALRIAAAEHI